MRLDKLTIKSQEAIQEAQGQCSARGHQSLEASHLLAALLAHQGHGRRDDGQVQPLAGDLLVALGTCAARGP